MEKDFEPFICGALAVICVIVALFFTYNLIIELFGKKEKSITFEITSDEYHDMIFSRHKNESLQEDIQCVENENKELRKAFNECTEENRVLRKELDLIHINILKQSILKSKSIIKSFSENQFNQLTEQWELYCKLNDIEIRTATASNFQKFIEEEYFKAN